MRSSTIDRIVGLLATAGYQPLTKPLEISSVRFEFAAALLGGDRVLDLVIIVDTSRESHARIRQKLEGLSRALDVVQSRRPLTAILVGPKLSASLLQLISRVCRVLVVDDKSDSNIDNQIQKSLAVLLPLSLPQPTSAMADPFAELSDQFENPLNDARATDLWAAAKVGVAEVESHLRAWIEKPLQAIAERPK